MAHITQQFIPKPGLIGVRPGTVPDREPGVRVMTRRVADLVCVGVVFCCVLCCSSSLLNAGQTQPPVWAHRGYVVNPTRECSERKDENSGGAVAIVYRLCKERDPACPLECISPGLSVWSSGPDRSLPAHSKFMLGFLYLCGGLEGGR